MSEKDLLLSDMKISPMKYSREEMFSIINEGILTKEDLVDTSNILTEHAYQHIKRYPRLSDEQRQLPISILENPKSEDGNIDVYFIRVPDSGKSCFLAGLMA